MRSAQKKEHEGAKASVNKRNQKRIIKQAAKDDSNKENDISELMNFKDAKDKKETGNKIPLRSQRRGQPLSQQVNGSVNTKSAKKTESARKHGSSLKTSASNSTSKKRTSQSVSKRVKSGDKYDVMDSRHLTQEDNSHITTNLVQSQQLRQMEHVEQFQVTSGRMAEFESPKERQNRLSLESLTLSENSNKRDHQQQEKNTTSITHTPQEDNPFGSVSSDQVSPAQQQSSERELKSDEKISTSKSIFYLYSTQTFTQDTIDYLIQRESDYCYDKNSIFTNQAHIKPFMREMLMDWIMEVSDEFKLKKQTFYLAVHFIDKYLSHKSNLKLEKFQLLGATALLVASKIEEIYCPRVKDFELATDCGFNEEQILKMERKILMQLQWLTNPTTINTWANLFMQKWDFYAQENPLNLSILDPQFYQSQKVPIFKSDFNEDYVMFRIAMQPLDMSVLDIEYMKHDPRHLAISSIIITLGLMLKVFHRHNVGESSSIHRPSLIELYLDEQMTEFSHMIIHYCEQICNISIHELHAPIKFVSQFYLAEPQLQLPSCLKDHSASTQEEFFSFQVHYKNMQEAVALVRKMKHSVPPLNN